MQKEQSYNMYKELNTYKSFISIILAHTNTHILDSTILTIHVLILNSGELCTYGGGTTPSPKLPHTRLVHQLFWSR